MHKMLISLLILLKITIHFTESAPLELVCSADCQLHVFHNIFKNFDPFQITLFLANSKNEEFYDINHILKTVVKKVPAVVIDTSSVKSNDPIFQQTSFGYPRLTNMFVIVYPSKDLVESSDANEVKSIIDLMVDIAPKPTRPRCLLIIFGPDEVLKSTVESILSFAWSRKFIDFTTLVLHRKTSFSRFGYKVTNQTVSYHYYNPFLDKYFSGPYQPNVELLPGKLKNFYGYKLVIAAINNPPYVLLKRNETGYPILNHTGSDHRIVLILRKAMNFTFELASSTFEYFTEGHNESLVYRLLTGEINISMNHLFVSKSNAYLEMLERSTITTSEDYTALMPNILDKRVKTSKDLLTYMGSAVGMFVIFYVLMHIMKFDKRIWSGTHIIEILLNVNIPQPVKWHERYIFFCITFMAFNFTINLLTELTEIQFEPYEDVAKNNLTLMKQQGYTPAILEQYQDIELEKEIADDKVFKAKLITLKTADECAFRLERGERIVCFMTKYLGYPLVVEHSQRYKEPKMKLMFPYLWSSWKTLLFEPGTPFLDGFNDKLQRLRDAGLLRRFVYDVTYHEKKSNQPDVEEILSKQIISTQWLINQLLLGYAFSSVVLIFEVMINRIKKAWIRRERAKLN